MHDNQPIQPGSLVLPKNATSPVSDASLAAPASPTPQVVSDPVILAPNVPPNTGDSLIKLRSESGLSLDAGSADVQGSPISGTTVMEPATMAQPAPAPATIPLNSMVQTAPPVMTPPPVPVEQSAAVPVSPALSPSQVAAQNSVSPQGVPPAMSQTPVAPVASMAQPMGVPQTPMPVQPAATQAPVQLAPAQQVPQPIQQPPVQPAPLQPMPQPVAQPAQQSASVSISQPAAGQPQPNPAVSQPTPTTQPPSASPPSDQNRQREWLVYVALAIAVISILAQVFVSGTPQYAVVLIGMSSVGIFLGFKTIRGGRKGVAVAVIIISVLALISAAVQAGIAINIANKCRTDPTYAAQSAQCQS